MHLLWLEHGGPRRDQGRPEGGPRWIRDAQTALPGPAKSTSLVVLVVVFIVVVLVFAFIVVVLVFVFIVVVLVVVFVFVF